jgi:murein DD-endopeptidase MepM/ murein hydrolase activator NlpD
VIIGDAFSWLFSPIVNRLRPALRRHIRATAVTASLTLLAGSAFLGIGGALTYAAPLPGTDALTPLAETLEVVSRRNMADITSRSLTTQVANAAQPDNSQAVIKTTAKSEASLTLTWEAPDKQPEADLTLRRGVGDAAPQTPAEGVEVPLSKEPGTAVDTGLLPNTKYSYTLFIQLPEHKPAVLGHVVETTRRYPTEFLPGQTIAVDDGILSPSGDYTLKMEGNGGVALLNKNSQKIWSFAMTPNPEGNLIIDPKGALAVVVGDKAIWTAKASGPGARLVLTDEGDLQFLGSDGSVVWSSAKQKQQLRSGDSPYPVSSSGWTQPGAGPVISAYGFRVHPLYGITRFHAGVDMTSGKAGRPIYAAHDGVVERVFTDSGGNPTITISHGGGVQTQYLHMMDGGILVSIGEKVVAGQKIGLTGARGQTTGPHLHFEMIVNGATTDPVGFLKDHGVTISK